ncbi:hypothetical protein DPEC_G00268420 [Dallia pectoralis]|uniref:Uncharacterized protein n=1 Tax=Dallia pectoralis TaxID=75939 RepID=A0ACC2FP84_DALPE|nr:hypothetical protein DPEC_G00268420 [Dallia pectoralis]
MVTVPASGRALALLPCGEAMIDLSWEMLLPPSIVTRRAPFETSKLPHASQTPGLNSTWEAGEGAEGYP